MSATQLHVGDVVVVGKPCMGNPAGARAIAVEEYDLGAGASWFLLFPNGNYDGFPPRDLVLFDVRYVGHDASLAGYRFQSAIRLYEDWRRGLFDQVWR